jgi:hypothetical protein
LSDELQGAQPEPAAETPPPAWEALPELPETDLAAKTAGQLPVEPVAAPPGRPGKLGRILSAVAIVVLSLGLLAATAWSIKLHRDKVQMQSTFDKTMQALGKNAPPALGQELTALSTDLSAGDYKGADTRLQALTQKLASNPADSGAPIPETAYSELPKGADTYFRAHSDLFRKFLLLCDQSRKLKEQGQDVSALRKARDAIIEAARLGQDDMVKQRLLTMAQMLGGGSNGDDPARAALRTQVEEFQKVAGEAQKQGRDMRAAAALMRRSEEAVKAGDLEKGTQLLAQATEAAKHAPKAPRGLALGGRGPGQAKVAGLVRALFQMMSLEEKNLSAAWEELSGARKLLSSDKPAPQKSQEVTKAIDSALAEMKAVAGRRKEFTAKMRTGTGGKAGTTLPVGPAPEPETLRQRMLRIIEQRLSDILDRVHGLSPEEYQKQKPNFIREIFKAVFEPPKESGKPGSSTTNKPALDRALRIRDKLAQGQPLIDQWEAAGKDPAEARAMLTKARQALYANDLATAEQAVDRALSLLRQTPTPPTPAPTLPYSKPATGGGTTPITPPATAPTTPITPTPAPTPAAP